MSIGVIDYSHDSLKDIHMDIQDGQDNEKDRYAANEHNLHFPDAPSPNGGGLG
jgi:hypothetical protein